ncbi:DUF368 domain-containing protein [Candidatus Marimicrobium litorale]|jgi:putative membrane protein|uniref:DUF368 domain-containing protein n=1 Tax=Candidatus Marimicrobium litorale TaxID=2518991 RepID=A0ABT3T2V3_9GAMM|nr:DUF368 domain-containing protein [Candidatus Marimicrobium litorale]MCX2975854.1 DUF368 domain-containing protein [Candidatus Marimicrobium litorale]
MGVVGVFLRGLLMGAADIVPGVSGGTVAFITGIYDTLLDSIRSVNIAFFRKVVTLDIAGAWEQVNGGFLVPLLLGVVTSIFSLAQVVSWILTHYPVPLWAFFFGLILASALVLLQSVQQWHPIRILCLMAGTAVALSIALSASVGLEMGYGGVFLAAFLAICAMILPGISGSFILVLLGMYNAVLLAIKSLDVTFILVFMIGAVCGLMCFSRLLHWLLERFQQATMAVLTGFLFGSLAVVWPWKRVLVWIERSNGELKPAQQLPVMPADFELYTGQDPQMLLCLSLMVAGFAVVWFVHARWGSSAAGG